MRRLAGAAAGLALTLASGQLAVAAPTATPSGPPAPTEPATRRATAAPTAAQGPTPPTARPTQDTRALVGDFPPIEHGRFQLGARWGAVGSWARYNACLDFVAPLRTPVRAVTDGVVVDPVGGGWAGNHVIIDHGPLGSTEYAHLSAVAVRPGDRVRQGQEIGWVGMTGRTFGPHLCFMHFPAGANVSNPYAADDPAPWLRALRSTAARDEPRPGRTGVGGLARTGV